MTHIILLGDSLIADNDWQSRMPSYKVYNFGYPGEMASGLFASLTEVKEQAPYADVIMVMVGTNDLLTGNFDFMHTLKKISLQLSRDYPNAEILFSSLFPMELPHLPSDTIANLNSRIEALAMQTGSCFLDTHHRFAVSDKQIFQEDGVHITDAAYEIWTRSLLEHIAFLIEND